MTDWLSERWQLWALWLAVAALVGPLLWLYATLWLLRSRRPRMSVSVSLARLLQLHVTVHVSPPGPESEGDDGENR